MEHFHYTDIVADAEGVTHSGHNAPLHAVFEVGYLYRDLHISMKMKELNNVT